jgi:hypothetical protein
MGRVGIMGWVMDCGESTWMRAGLIVDMDVSAIDDIHNLTFGLDYAGSLAGKILRYRYKV